MWEEAVLKEVTTQGLFALLFGMIFVILLQEFKDTKKEAKEREKQLRETLDEFREESCQRERALMECLEKTTLSHEKITHGFALFEQKMEMEITQLRQSVDRLELD